MTEVVNSPPLNPVVMAGGALGGGEAAGGGGGGTGRTWPHMGPGTPGVGDSNVPRLIAPLVNTGKAVDSAFRPIGR